ncbi:hypothetical protein JS530_08795 [Bifidobacterium sp. LC6]|uniref:CDF family cation diffusion facilitator n=1 Tax=Bifidobacterium colobi TaxID=2809026 RepID=A0ABS5UYF1_9BIFI|nr:hypothetical protein [Bifidobacterium colobi]MBT1175591.1 hypothetical protein [Bifidobacterium colobi]
MITMFSARSHESGRHAAHRAGHGVVRRTVQMMLAIAFAVTCAMAGLTTIPLPSAHAAGATVTTNVEGGTLNPDGETTVDLSGSGFQSVQGGFGGIYVLFGWVSDPNGGAWRPSQGGITGENYRYVPDNENNPTGYDVFVAFPGSSTESAANGGTIASDGTWHAKITVPGAKFTSYDRAGNPADVDCTTTQCGIITIGAHGVVNANNETFTPLTFGSAQEQSSDSGDSATHNNDGTNANTTAAQAKKSNNASAVTGNGGTAGTAEEGTTMTVMPTLGIAGWLIVAAIIILGIAIIVLAAGVGGYLAVKSLLLGVSPAAMDKEIARRERKAEDVRIREQMKSIKRQRKQYQQLAKAQAKADRIQGIVLPDEVPARAASAVPQTDSMPNAPVTGNTAADTATNAVSNAALATGGVDAAQTMALPAIHDPFAQSNAAESQSRADIRGFFTNHQGAQEGGNV